MSGESRSTLNHTGSTADLCRERGWGVGTYLAGDEGYGDTVIKISSLGEGQMLARAVAGHGGVQGRESSWVLWCRDWREIPPDVAEMWAERDAARAEVKRLRGYLAAATRVFRGEEAVPAARAAERIDEILATSKALLPLAPPPTQGDDGGAT